MTHENGHPLRPGGRNVNGPIKQKPWETLGNLGRPVSPLEPSTLKSYHQWIQAPVSWE